jgi:uncharacterized protein YacL
VTTEESAIQALQEDHSAVVAVRPRRYAGFGDELEAQRRKQRFMLMAIRTVFLALMVTVPLLPFVGTLSTVDVEAFGFWDYMTPVLVTFVFGTVVLLIDASTPNKRLASVFATYLGIIAGLIGALAIGYLIDLIGKSWDLTAGKTGPAYLQLVKLAIGIAICYLAVSIVLTTKDDFRLVIPYVEFAKQVRGVRPLLVDTSILIDGRIDLLGLTGFVDAPLVVPQFVLEELQTLADSGDKLKRARGRRGLAMVSKLQANAFVDVSIDNADLPRKSVDHMLLDLAKAQSLRILTTDYNLNKVAEIHGVSVLNLNDLANALKSQAVPGESLTVEVVKHGEGATQGVGYLPDGTMVVIEDAAKAVGQTVTCTVTNSLQTTAGRMIFAQMNSNGPVSSAPTTDTAGVEQMAHAATHQPRAPVRTANGGRADEGDARRNPRR